jgi:NAD-dependent dihydropyrimidine dehydrogenase PreA subunit
MKNNRDFYTGLPRKEIDWFPRIDKIKCKPEECGFLCVKYCPFGVFSKEGVDGKSKVSVSQPYECNVGDESCKFQCPFGAISFPSREELKEMLRIVRAKYQK